MKARRLITAGAAASLLTLGLYGVAVGSDDSPQEPAVVDRSAEQNPEAAAERPSDEDLARSDAVTDVAEEISLLDESDESGFGTIHTDHDKGSVTVFWSGKPPQALLDLAEKQPNGITVSIESSSYSRAELNRGADAIDKAGLYKKLDLMFVDPDVESGLTIGTGRKEPFTEDELALVREASKIDAIKVEYNIPPVVGFSRTNDAGPWKGGGRLRLRTPSDAVVNW
jgi:hypothetical protein